MPTSSPGEAREEIERAPLAVPQRIRRVKEGRGGIGAGRLIIVTVVPTLVVSIESSETQLRMMCRPCPRCGLSGRGSRHRPPSRTVNATERVWLLPGTRRASTVIDPRTSLSSGCTW